MTFSPSIPLRIARPMLSSADAIGVVSIVDAPHRPVEVVAVAGSRRVPTSLIDRVARVEPVHARRCRARRHGLT